MNPWIIILFATAAAVFGLDYLFRRKKWKDNSKSERVSLLIHMFSVAPHILLSVFGMLWGIVSDTPETALGRALYDATLLLGGVYFIVAVAAVILSFVFRKKGKVKASIWTNVIAFVYFAVVIAVNELAGKIL